MHNLTAVEVKSVRFDGVNRKLADGGGLYLLITRSGKYWRYDYRYGRKRKTLALGVYPEVSLKVAREKHRDARVQLANKIDPSSRGRGGHEADLWVQGSSFESIAWQWFDRQRWTDGHRRTVKSRLVSNVLPWLGQLNVAEIGARDVLNVCRKIESRGAYETAHRVKSICSQVFRYGIAIGVCNSDPCRDLKNALMPSEPKHMATITDPVQVGALMRAIEGYQGNQITKFALQLAPLLFVRPGELRHAEWCEIDFDRALWKIPARKMKMRQAHLVPLARQTKYILDDLNRFTGNGRYLFPSMRTGDRPISDNTILSALRRMGYGKEEITVHGFRGMASTLLHESGWPSVIIERQLAHTDRNSVRAAYNHAEYLDDRRKLMQSWADYLDQLKARGCRF